MRRFLPWVILCTPLIVYGVLRVLEIFYDGTVGKEHLERLRHQTQCRELRTEFFIECQKTMTRQQCEALYAQARVSLFDGPPHLPFAYELDCSLKP